jgi:hypothetical protein
MAKVLQITNVELIANIEALKGNKTINEVISEMLSAYKEKLNSTAKTVVRRSEIDTENARKTVNHTELFLQILEKAKKEYSVKEKKQVIPISYFTSAKTNGIATLHYDVVKALCESLNIDLTTYATSKKAAVKI